ncbi:MYXO-CTERM sorting domain-containing protein [Labilithrix luteola]|nr:MYXO-CTERM sorting domain-containing protein [Labilithrix luteola]
MRNGLGVGLVFGLIGWSTVASAGTVTAQGAVTVLTDASQIANASRGDFDEGPTDVEVPAAVYAARGLTWRSGELTTFLPGVTQTGAAILPFYQTGGNYFPAVANGGVASGLYAIFAGVATFSVPVTQVGLTASANGTQYLTVWNGAGKMIGQITWEPSDDSSFIGLDSGPVAIAMVAYGNHDLWNGEAYSPAGPTTFSDSWRWALKCQSAAQCDDGNPCTTDSCNPSGQCVHAASTGNACNDGNACTQVDTCQAGVCTGSNPVTCAPLDECHAAGVCDPGTGQCSNPAKSDGAPCNDGNACTQTDRCQAGVCTGSDQVTCAAPDACKMDGVCSPITGKCSYANQADGIACTASDLCNANPTCHAGSCTGTPVVCAPIDQCHGAGTCDPTTGTCSTPALADGTTCDDGNACTQRDTCVNATCTGSMQVRCDARDGCHEPGVCDPSTGACTEPVKADGASCTGGTCASGACEPAKVEPVPEPSVDAGASDAGNTASAEGGGGCSSAPVSSTSRAGLVALGLFGLFVLRRRRAAS